MIEEITQLKAIKKSALDLAVKLSDQQVDPQTINMIGLLLYNYKIAEEQIQTINDSVKGAKANTFNKKF